MESASRCFPEGGTRDAALFPCALESAEPEPREEFRSASVGDPRDECDVELQGRAFPETDVDSGLSKPPNEARPVGRPRRPSEEGGEAVGASGPFKAELPQASEQFPLRGDRAVAGETLHPERTADPRSAWRTGTRCGGQRFLDLGRRIAPGRLREGPRRAIPRHVAANPHRDV